jgi:hypothetical protein
MDEDKPQAQALEVANGFKMTELFPLPWQRIVSSRARDVPFRDVQPHISSLAKEA